MKNTEQKPDWEKEIEIALIKIENYHSEAMIGDFNKTSASFNKAKKVLRELLAQKEEQHKKEMEASQKIDWSIDVRYEKDLVTAFNKFIKKWCGSHYPHLIDSDEQDGQFIRDKIEQLKQQHQKELQGLGTEQHKIDEMINTAWNNGYEKAENKLKQQHKVQLQSLRKEQRGIDFIESEVKRIWVSGHKLTQENLRSLILSECAGYNTAVIEFNKKLDQMLQDSDK